MVAASLTRGEEACPACAGTVAGELAPGEPLLPGEGQYRWFACQACGSHFASPRKAMDYEQAYRESENYLTSLQSFADSVRAVERCSDDHLNRMLAHRLLRAAGAPERSLLDVGAGSGFLLALAARVGFRVAAVEPSSEGRASIARHVPGAEAHASLADVAGTFSHVSALEVLEHVEDPVAFLVQLRFRLSPDGVLLLSMPNVERLYWRVLHDRGGERRYWLQGGVGDTAPHHLTRFSRRGLEAALARAGFGSFHVGYSPQEAITFALLGLGAEPKWRLRIAGVEVPVPFAFLRGYLTTEVAERMWRADESTGFFLMGLAAPGEGRAEELEGSFRLAREEVLGGVRAYANRDLLRILWDERGRPWRAVAGPFRRLARGRR